jgi:hypothetical protein
VKLSKADYEELLGLLCPYCKYKIPDWRSDKWFHDLLDSPIRNIECGATRIRGKIEVLD